MFNKILLFLGIWILGCLFNDLAALFILGYLGLYKFGFTTDLEMGKFYLTVSILNIFYLDNIIFSFVTCCCWGDLFDNI